LVKNMEAGVRANALCLYSTTFNLRLVLVEGVYDDIKIQTDQEPLFDYGPPQERNPRRPFRT